jgi:hypothetical protein
MKTRFLFLSFSFFIMTSIFSQKKYLTERPVYFDVIKQYIFVFSKQDSAIRTNYGDQDTAFIKVFDLTSKGAMKFIFRDTSTNIIVKGQYKEAMKLSKPKDYSRDGARVRTSKDGIARSYYRPLRDGIWYYYDSDGNVVKKEVYKQGVRTED